jgi:hypothetical protein
VHPSLPPPVPILAQTSQLEEQATQVFGDVEVK